MAPRRTATALSLALIATLSGVGPSGIGPMGIGPVGIGTASAATLAPAPGVLAELLPAPALGQTQLQIGAFNDFHGRLQAPSRTADGQPIGGAAQLAGALNAMRAQQPNTIALSAGDNIGASTFTSFIAGDAPTIAAINAMGVLASAVGNHEFDRGYRDLVDRVGVNGTPGTGGPPLADFPYLGANVTLKATGQPAMPGYSVADVDGIRLGFIGVVTQQTPSLVAPDGIAELAFTDPVVAANTVAEQLSDANPANGEADILVLLAHEGSAGTDCATVATEGAFGQIVQRASPQIDAIISGHTHQRYDCEYPVAGRTVARPVVSAQSYSAAVDRIVFTVDAASRNVVAQAHQVLPVQGFAPDPAVERIVADAVAYAETVGARPVGRITADINRAFRGGEDDRGTPSPLGNLVADAQLQQTEGAGAQIAFENPGGIRDDLTFASSGAEGDGVVTYAEAAAVQPFANSVVTKTFTGAQVRQVLEEQWQPAGSSRPYLALGVSKGFFFTYNPDAPAGRHVVSATLDGVELDLKANYRVTVNSFLAAGGDNFATLAAGTDRAELGRTDLEAFTDYLSLPDNQGLAPDETPRSAVAVASPAPPAPTAPVTSAPAAPAPTGAAPTVAPAAAPPAAPTRIARTGIDAGPLVAIGGALVLAGGLLLTAVRRRRDV